MSILEKLKNDHNEVKELLKKAEELIEEYPKVNESQEIKLIEKIAEKLVPHSKAEEEILYAALREKDEENLQPYEGVEEHHLAIQLLKDLRKGSLQKSERTSKIKILKEILLHHIKEEEGEYFKTAKKIFTATELETMGEVFLAKKEILKKQAVKKISELASANGAKTIVTR